MSRQRGSLNLYLCYDVRDLAHPRLIVARSFEQADSMVPPGWASKIATPMEAYRFARVGVELEYYFPQKAITA